MSKYSFTNKIKQVNSPLFKIRYCSRCCMPETEEGYNDDEHGMCRICRSSEQKMHINWIERRKMLEEILEKCQSLAGNNYDCMVPISGGKDSSFQLHILTKVFNLKPLVVTYSHNWFSKTGWYNLMMAIKTFNVDHIMFTPNRSLVNRIAKRSLGMIGDACWSCHAGVGAFPLHIAVKYKIPVIIYGESVAEVTQRGDYFQYKFEYDKNYYTTFSAKKTPDEMTCNTLNKKDLFMYQLPTDQEYEQAKVKILHLGDFIFWDDERQMEFIRDTYCWKETDVENAYKGYKSAECIMPGVHDFTCYLKRGWGRAAFHASMDVRNGILTRDEGFQLINSIDPQRPEVLDYYLKITGMTEPEFYKTIEKHIEPSLRKSAIPILPKDHKNKERLIPFSEQLLEKHRRKNIDDFRLNDICFTCGLESEKNSTGCENCAENGQTIHNYKAAVNSLKEHFDRIRRSAGDNYDCIVPLDESWESAYLLHLVSKIYNLKPLVITFDKYHFTEVGWYNVVNCLETFNVDQIIFTPNSILNEKFKVEAEKSGRDKRHFPVTGLYSFLIKTACEFKIPTIIGFHDQLKMISKEAGSEKLTYSRVDFDLLSNISGQLTGSGISQRDIYLFSAESLDKVSVEELRVINAKDYFDFNSKALMFVKKYYGWKKDIEPGRQQSFVEQFLEENKPKLSPEYIIGKSQKEMIRGTDKESDLSNLSIKSMVRGYAGKHFSPVDVAKAVIKKVERMENSVHAWEVFDPDKYLKLAGDCEREIRQNGVSKILDGIPVGVKDVFNTVDFPTQMGSTLWKGFTPGNDARAVYHITRAGAIVCGKTVTSEFAVHALNKTLNPHAPDRTPGTSSSGSAAAIATGMVPVTLGTQSGASIIRPASFCGIYGFKPSFGLIPRTGVLKTTDTLDNIGFFVRHAEDLEDVFQAICLHGTNYPMSYREMNQNKRKLIKKKKKWKIAFVKTHTWDFAEEYAKQSMLSWVKKISGFTDFEVVEINLPSGMEKCHELHSIIYDYCLAYYFREEFNHRSDLSEWLREQIEHGKNITVPQYQNALKEQVALWQLMDEFLKGYDVMASLSTSGIAPLRGNRETPDPGLMWTMTNLPSLNIPAFLSPEGLPFGLQLSSRRYSDLLILEITSKLIEYGVIPKESNPKFDY